MSFFVQSTAAPVPKTKNVRILSLALVAIFTLLAVAQLFMYERFPEVIASYWLPGGQTTAKLVAGLFVAGEVLALPFWLRMRLSPAMRIMSMGLGWLVTLGWLLLGIWANVTTNALSNLGMLGAEVSLPVGWWTVFVFMALGVLVGWVSWGLWPFVVTRHHELGKQR